MGRHASEPTGSTFEQAPADTHVARCIKLVDLGTQHGEYEGKPTTRNQVWITFELPNALMEGGKPFIVSAFLTNSLSEKAKMRAWLESWRGRAFTEDELKGFDLMKVLGQPCLVTVIHSDKGKAVINSVTKVPKGMEVPPQVNPSFAFWLDEFDQAKFDSLPEGIRDIIAKSDEWKGMSAPKGSAALAAMEEDIPF